MLRSNLPSNYIQCRLLCWLAHNIIYKRTLLVLPGAFTQTMVATKGTAPASSLSWQYSIARQALRCTSR